LYTHIQRKVTGIIRVSRCSIKFFEDETTDPFYFLLRSYTMNRGMSAKVYKMADSWIVSNSDEYNTFEYNIFD